MYTSFHLDDVMKAGIAAEMPQDSSSGRIQDKSSEPLARGAMISLQNGQHGMV